MTGSLTARFAAAAIAAAILQPVQTIQACSRCGWTPHNGPTVTVSTVAALERAVASAKPRDTILLADGSYALRRSIDIATNGVTLRGKSGDRTKVVLRGGGMTSSDPIGVAISVSAPNVTIADLTIRDVRFHAVQVRGESGASGFTLHNARLLDTGQQLLKGSVSEAPIYADFGVIACSDFEYTSNAPSDYTNGVDLLATRGWVIRDNHFARIRGPQSQGFRAGSSILVWWAGVETVVERNLIVDSYRGITLGLTDELPKGARKGERTYDHTEGRIQNNVIVNLNPWADVAIDASASRNLRIEHNTVLVEGKTPWSIDVRFPASNALVRNNLTNRRVFQRDGATVTLDGNVMSARAAWFVNPRTGDLHLTSLGRPAIDAGVPIPDLTDDFDRGVRPAGRAPDAGAFEMGTQAPRTRAGGK
ncbi:MAG: DUF1565 domain-containing protein [Acidobacteriota bacterium]